MLLASQLAVLAAEATTDPTLGDITSGVVDAFGLLLALHLLQVLVLLALVRLVDVHEREPIGILVAMFLWGGTAAILFSLVFNTWASIILPPDVDVVFGAAIYAPINEELSKAMALVLAFAGSMWAGRRWGSFEFGGVTDGIVYGAAVGFGFAFFENAQYFANFVAMEGLESGTAVFLQRTDFLGVTGSLFGHGSYSAVAGAGLGLAMWSRGLGRKLAYGLGGIALAMLLHASWNGMVSLVLVREYTFAGTLALFTGAADTIPQSLVEHINATIEQTISRAEGIRDGVKYVQLAGIVTAVGLWLRHEGKVIRFELAEEVNYGVLPREEWDLLSSVRARTTAFWAHVRQGRFDVARAQERVHHALVDLAMQKWRLRTVGGDPSSLPAQRARINVLRDHVAQLAQLSAPPIPATVAGGATPDAGSPEVVTDQPPA